MKSKLYTIQEKGYAEEISASKWNSMWGFLQRRTRSCTRS